MAGSRITTLYAPAKVLWIVVVLAVLEISLSFDNAVVNATVLQGMDEVWRGRFLTWGMIFAVYGMYIFFPLADRRCRRGHWNRRRRWISRSTIRRAING